MLVRGSSANVKAASGETERPTNFIESIISLGVRGVNVHMI